MAKNKETNKKNQQTQDLMNKAGNNTTSNKQNQTGAQDHCGGSNSTKDCGNGYSSHN